MSTVYSSNNTQWPLLQSKTEQKFKSGLFTVSAEFIGPSGQGSLPQSIETSIGEIPVWPDPTINTGTDGFDRINATGYGIWSPVETETIYGFEVFELSAVYKVHYLCKNPNGCGQDIDGIDIPCGGILRSVTVYANQKKRILKQSASVKKIGEEVPAAPALKITDLTLTEVTEYTPANFGIFLSPSHFSGEFGPRELGKSSFLESFKQNQYGEIFESEAVYALLVSGIIDFGDYYEISDPEDCAPTT